MNIINLVIEEAIEVIVDPRCSEAQFLGQLIKQIIKECSVLVFGFNNQRRRLPLGALPDGFNWIQVR